jgi:type I restriction enzyme S subunit
MKTQVEDLRRASTGTAQGVISSALLGSVNVPLAPFREQRRIVAKIDGLTARTTRARTDLARIPALVVKYKARIMELGTSGELTRDWRATRDLSKGATVRLGSVVKKSQLRNFSEIIQTRRSPSPTHG